MSMEVIHALYAWWWYTMMMALEIEPDFGKSNIFLCFPSPLVTLIIKKEGVMEIICRICNDMGHE